MRHELSPKERMYLEAHPAVRFCPWCLRKRAEAKYSRLPASLVKVSGKFLEENGTCAECGQEMNVFVTACRYCGIAAPPQEHFIECFTKYVRESSRQSSRLVELDELDDTEEDDEDDIKPAPTRVFRGGLPGLGKRR